MASRVLTLKYRPQRFDEVLIQTHVTETLGRAIEKNRLANAYLFTGPRGVGKTTTARIFAKSLNCESGPTVSPCNKCSFCVDITASRSMDVLEIDGASNRGIDQVRELRENIRYAPSAARFKVYIIDEVHMLTDQAFNALLKTLEEPPAHAKFVFATTHAHEVPATIISRCQRFDFRKATVAEIRGRLTWLAGKEGITASDEALTAIARRADGAIRDAESILDQLAAFRPDGIALADVEHLLGVVPAEMFCEYARLLLDANAAELIRFIDRLFSTGYDHLEFYTGIVEHLRTLLLLAVAGPSESLGLLPEETARLTEQARRFGKERLLSSLAAITRAETATKTTRMPRVLLEVLSLELVEECGRHPADTSRPPTADSCEPQAAGAGTAIRPTADRRPPADDRRQSEARDALPGLEAVWTGLRARVTAEKPMLAAVLDLATETALSSSDLTITLPYRHKAVANKLEAEASYLDSVLADVSGRPLHLRTKVEDRPTHDPVKERLSRRFGPVHEE